MLENIKKKMVKTRKEHECFACLGVIKKSENAVYVTAKQDEKHTRFHLHQDCNIAINKNQLVISHGCIKNMPVTEGLQSMSEKVCWTCGHYAFGCFVTGEYNNTVQVDGSCNKWCPEGTQGTVTDYGYDDGKNEEWLKDDMSNL
ncbi:hypothetical protein P4604_22840 [Lysinibacillus capsici]|uniref:hypothetical protein n=1 Tax=Lysinibacillus capsici TaxID=2115968 RepID=UPI002E20BAB5|nr:hypothetical protein [Lysinibacillus capsici]